MDGINYFFHSRAGFEALVEQGRFSRVGGIRGELLRHPPSSPWKQQMAAGRPVLLEIELEGARQVRRSFPEAVFRSFLAPPSFEELERRIRGRGTDAEDAIVQRRLTRAREGARGPTGIRRCRDQ